MEHLLFEYLIGERGLDLPDTIFGQVGLSGFYRPRHHVHMGVLTLVMEGSVPTEILERDLHGSSNIIAVCTQERTPRLGVVILL